MADIEFHDNLKDEHLEFDKIEFVRVSVGLQFLFFKEGKREPDVVLTSPGTRIK